jgi:hypothetical protein
MAGEGMTLAGIRQIFVLEKEIADLKLQLQRARSRGRRN